MATLLLVSGKRDHTLLDASSCRASASPCSRKVRVSDAAGLRIVLAFGRLSSVFFAKEVAPLLVSRRFLLGVPLLSLLRLPCVSMRASARRFVFLYLIV